jgi:hypothetical protein
MVLVLTGCAARTWMPVAATSLAITATACDWKETRDTAQFPMIRQNWEANPVLGGNPATATVDSYFTIVGSAEMVAGASMTALHGRWRWWAIAAMLLVAGIETETAIQNVRQATPSCY